MQIIETRHSPAHKGLLKLARASGIAIAKALQHMLWRIDAHWTLGAFLLVCTNLREVLRRVEEKYPAELQARKMDAWLPALDWVLAPEQKHPLIVSVGRQVELDFDKDEHHPILGVGAERYALYTALCNSHPRPELSVAYQSLQGYLLIAHVEAMGRFTTYKQYRNYDGQSGMLVGKADPLLAMRAVRYLSKADPVPEFLLESLSLEGTAGEFVEALSRARPTSDTNANRLYAVERFIIKAFGLKKQSSGGGGNRLSRPE